MTENNQQSQEQNAASEGNDQEANQSQREGTNRGFNTSDVPEYRLEEVNRKKKEAEQRAKAAEQKLAQMEQEREQAQEERASKQGEYQELADKRLRKVQKLEEELKETKASWTRERRMNIWSQAAQGIVKSEAIVDAFSFLNEDELSNIDDTDPAAFKTLAQNLVEVKPYLSTEGPRGAGSGGSSRPVMSGNSNGGTTVAGRKQIFKTGRRPSWK